jgi:hypothetical protein
MLAIGEINPSGTAMIGNIHQDQREVRHMANKQFRIN